MGTRVTEQKLFTISFLSNKDKSVIQQKVSCGKKKRKKEKKQKKQKNQNKTQNREQCSRAVIAVNIDTSHNHIE